MEKAGYANFKIVDKKSGKFFCVNNDDFLTSYQEKQMSFQPDFILEYAHFLGDHFSSQGHNNIQVFVESYVALNGRMSMPYINSKVDLYQEKFNPVFAGEEPDEIVLDHRKRIDACDTIVLIAPIWNFRMPAIVEGWIDKVLAPPWAFKFQKLWGNYGYPIGNLKDKKAIIFCTYGSPRLAITTFFLNLPIRRLKRGVFHMCGIYNINYRRYFAVPFVSDKKREEFLNDVKKTALNI